MPKISDKSALQQVKDALEKYKRAVESTDMQPSTKQTYLLHARNFVRWLDDDFDPGATVRRD